MLSRAAPGLAGRAVAEFGHVGRYPELLQVQLTVLAHRRQYNVCYGERQPRPCSRSRREGGRLRVVRRHSSTAILRPATARPGSGFAGISQSSSLRGWPAWPRRRWESNPLEPGCSRWPCRLASASGFQCPRQELNLVCDLRGVACDPAHSEDKLAESRELDNTRGRLSQSSAPRSSLSASPLLQRLASTHRMASFGSSLP